MRIYILLSLISIIGTISCSGSKYTNEVPSSDILHLMVIDSQNYTNDLTKVCAHTSECTAPLICVNSRCEVPPSIVNRVESDTPTLKFKNGDTETTLYIEVVDDNYTTQRGMMMRRTCAPNWGMLFVFPSESNHSFWMHNTYIPLDIVFIRADGTVANAHENAEPLNDGPRYPSVGKVRYVLELPAGSVQTYHITTDTKFDISPYANRAEKFQSGYRFQL